MTHHVCDGPGLACVAISHHENGVIVRARYAYAARARVTCGILPVPANRDSDTPKVSRTTSSTVSRLTGRGTVISCPPKPSSRPPPWRLWWFCSSFHPHSCRFHDRLSQFIPKQPQPQPDPESHPRHHFPLLLGPSISPATPPAAPITHTGNSCHKIIASPPRTRCNTAYRPRLAATHAGTGPRSPTTLGNAVRAWAAHCQ